MLFMQQISSVFSSGMLMLDILLLMKFIVLVCFSMLMQVIMLQISSMVDQLMLLIVFFWFCGDSSVSVIVMVIEIRLMLRLQISVVMFRLSRLIRVNNCLWVRFIVFSVVGLLLSVLLFVVISVLWFLIVNWCDDVCGLLVIVSLVLLIVFVVVIEL